MPILYCADCGRRIVDPDFPCPDCKSRRTTAKVPENLPKPVMPVTTVPAPVGLTVPDADKTILSGSSDDTGTSVSLFLEQKNMLIRKKASSFRMPEDRNVPFSSVIGAELITSTVQMSQTELQKSGAIGRALVGAALAGGVGAMIGAETAKTDGKTVTQTVKIVGGVRIYTTDLMQPMIELTGDEAFCRSVYATALALSALRQSD